MKDLKITWGNPADSSGIVGNYIYRKTGDHTTVTDKAAFRTGAVNVGSVGPDVAEFVDVAVPDGEYTYGVFSYNESGCGPGDLADVPHTVLTVVAPDSGPALLRANYDIQTSNTFLQWLYSNSTIDTQNWLFNAGSMLIPGSAQGGYAIFSAGITSTKLYGGIKDVSYNPAGGKVPDVPIISLTSTDFSFTGWGFGSLTLWPKLPIPYFNSQLEITNFPISYDQYYPLYTTNQQAEDRLTLYGLPINVKEVTIDYPITDTTAQSHYTSPSTESLTMYLPELPLADAASNYSDFSKRWDPDVLNGMPHDDSSFPVVDQGMTYNGVGYNHDGTLR